MNRIKIAFIGAGSVVFSRNLIADLCGHQALQDAHLALVDIDPDRLETATMMARSIADQMQVPLEISAHTKRESALDGADFVICCIGVGGMDATRIDLELPARFGLHQTVGDTLGVGGIFRAVRSIPELLRIGHDMRRLCPNALLLNYTNPMAMHCLAVERALPDIRHVGLCHGVKNTAQTLRMLVEMSEEPPEKIERHFQRPMNAPERVAEWQNWMRKGLDPKLSYTCAGINHMAFFLHFESAGKDLYPAIRRAMDIPHLHRFDPVRFELMRRLGYFMTETSGHTAEYVPWFLRDDEQVKACHLQTSSYLDTCQRQDQQYQDLRAALHRGENVITTPYSLSVEYGSRIINACVTNQPYVFNGNVHNRSGALIRNLPGDSCVEVPCVVNAQGVQPTAIGELPPQCAALIRTNINVQDLTVRGILEGRRDAIHQAAMLDPNTAAHLPLDKIDELVDTLFEAHRDRLPENLC